MNIKNKRYIISDDHIHLAGKLNIDLNQSIKNKEELIIKTK